MMNHYKNWRPGLNFINVLCTAYMHTDPESVKDTDDLTVFFMLSGSTSVKAAHKMLVKLTPNFVQLLKFFNVLQFY